MDVEDDRDELKCHEYCEDGNNEDESLREDKEAQTMEMVNIASTAL